MISVPQDISPEVFSATWDAAVIGAGPAGAVLAHQLARAGCRTILIERAHFPRDKVCGGCLNTHSLELLSRVGLGDIVTSLGAAPVRSLRIGRSGRELTLGLPSGKAVSRRALDAALARAASAAGAQLLEGCTASVLPDAPDNGSDQSVREVQLQSGGRTAGTLRAGVVIAADGLGHPSLRMLPEFECQVQPAARIGLGATFIADSSTYSEGAIHMAVGQRGYVGLARVEGGLLNVAAAVDRSLVQESGGASAAIGQILLETGWPVTDEIRDAQWHGTPPLTRRSPRLAGHRTLLVGDAGGYVEPFTGEGMAWALLGAITAEPLVLAGLREWTVRLENEWATSHRRLVGRRQTLCRYLAALLRNRRAADTAFWCASLAPWLAAPLIQRVNRRTTSLEISPL